MKLEEAHPKYPADAVTFIASAPYLIILGVVPVSPEYRYAFPVREIDPFLANIATGE